jgi:hypothetical protein
VRILARKVTELQRLFCWMVLSDEEKERGAIKAPLSICAVHGSALLCFAQLCRVMKPYHTEPCLPNLTANIIPMSKAYTYNLPHWARNDSGSD